MKERSLFVARERLPLPNHPRPPGMMNKQWGSFERLVVFLMLLSVYVAGACYQGFLVNVDLEKTDQSAYMDYAKSMKTSHYEYIGGRNRMPVYPFLQSLFYNPKLTDEEFFQRGKLVNIILSLVLLILLYVILRRFLNELESQVLILITAFTVFIYKAGYFQCELLFYFLNFCLFLLFWRCMKQPSLWAGALSGAVAVLAWLTKASVIPAVMLFLSFYIAILIINIFKRKEGKNINKDKYILKNISVIVVFLIVFFLTLYPYISTSKKIFGHYFYNVNSTLYIWYDSWEGVKEGTRAHGDRLGWPQMPPSEIPSFTKYIQEHSLQQFFSRLFNGFGIILGKALLSYGYLQFFCIYFLVCLAVISKNRQEISTIVKRDNNFIILLYLTAYFLTYGLLYAFYTPISSGSRLFLAQFLPALFTMVYFISAIKVDFFFNSINFHVNNEALHVIIFYILMLYIIFQMPFHLQFYSGT